MLPKLGGNTRRLCSQRLFWLNFLTKKKKKRKKKVGLEAGKEKEWKGMRDFPGGPMVKNPPCNSRDAGLIPVQGTKVPHAVGQLSPRTTTTESVR